MSKVISPWTFNSSKYRNRKPNAITQCKIRLFVNVVLVSKQCRSLAFHHDHIFLSAPYRDRPWMVMYNPKPNVKRCPGIRASEIPVMKPFDFAHTIRVHRAS